MVYSCFNRFPEKVSESDIKSVFILVSDNNLILEISSVFLFDSSEVDLISLIE